MVVAKKRRAQTVQRTFDMAGRTPGALMKNQLYAPGGIIKTMTRLLLALAWVIFAVRSSAQPTAASLRTMLNFESQTGPGTPRGWAERERSLRTIESGLFRYWNIIQYWFPYRDLIGENWNAALITSRKSGRRRILTATPANS